MNIQNIPSDGPVKEVFISRRPDGVLAFLDYQQIEPRLFAYYCSSALQDPTVANWFREGRDVYREISGRAHDKPADQVTDEERTVGKVLFLMTLYSAGPRKIAEALNCEYLKALDLYKTFHNNLPQLRALSNPKPRNEHVKWSPGLIERQLQRRGYLLTPWGRPLRPEEYGAHKMMNKLIQGSAAHLMKRALIRLYKEQTEDAWLVATIHDEVVYDAERDALPWLWETAPGVMIDEPLILEHVPLGVDMEVGVNWKRKETYV